MSDRSTSRGFGLISRAGRVERRPRPWVGVEDLEERRLLATFVVNSNADLPAIAPGPILPFMPLTLRQAIVNANATTAADTILFNLPTGATTIHPLTALPTVTGPTTIDGTSQPGYAGSPNVTLDGTGTLLPDPLTGNTDGLRFEGGSSTLRGVIIGGFDGLTGAGVSIAGPGGNVIAGNWIGTDVTGSLPRANFEGLVIDGSSNNRIGGTTAADRNVISASGLDGVRFASGGDTGNVVSGNYIGTNAAGDAPLTNGLSGVSVEAGPVSDLLIGGTAAGAGNVISGNGLNGVTITDVSGVRVAGNRIGTNAAGTAAIPNGFTGVNVTGGASDVVIGGATAAARNVISGNGGDGVLIDATGTGNTVQGNHVGTNAVGTAPIPNLGNGVSVATGGVLVGGSTAAAGNLISGNDQNGILLTGDANRVEFNRIGTTADATAALANDGDGVRIAGADNVIGTTTSGNTIAYNGNVGVVVEFDPAFVRNAIRGDNIYLNGGLGIDLGDDGVTMNDPQDPDEGPNEFQNFPVLASITLSGGAATIKGTLNSTPNSTFAVDLFVSQIWDTTTYGEGQKYLGSTTVTTDAAGNGSFTATLPGVPSGWNYFAATATDAAGNTSEFSYDPTPGAPADDATPAKAATSHARGPFGNRKLAALFDHAAAGDWVEKLQGLLARL
jgi:titin